MRSLVEFSTVVGPYAVEVVRLLAAEAPGLMHLTFVNQCAASWRHEEDIANVLHFPSLQSIRLCGAPYLGHFLQYLDAPKLARLQIEDLRIDDVDVLAHYVRAVTTPAADTARFPQLRWLGLEVHAVSETASAPALGHLCQLVAAFPRIQHLTFSGPDVGAFVHELRSGGPKPAGVLSAFLPALETFSLFGSHDYGFLYEVAALAEARKAAGVPLRSVELSVMITLSRNSLPQKLCKILQMHFRGTRTTGVMYPRVETWVQSTYEREERRTTFDDTHLFCAFRFRKHKPVGDLARWKP
ncbi:uncharacterized protein C8Q71DRAFT_762951 [Rhodofomes roseus]|uniref:Uncharacterized protein n=1 Tax=Rhodofomes roseus TaxID=34475 RepID=A0ABQ8KDI4_9APHY|nr:uncharacterized protein C8Q71DRAFT_762951 [Rhodofomes roseus]KAH9835658.1 hypothetical protein C8Q71DRAFT_762951 [Rhodofomes roseus]